MKQKTLKDFRFINHQVKIFNKQKTSLITKSLFFTSVVTLSIYVVLFTTYPPIHDYFHEIRHALAIIPCH
ncbi:MAG: CbtB-domain containing protein [Proteobacteria bacterium]|nr:CbtB-domain containing protein [Pseudomonadota bacterium]